MFNDPALSDLESRINNRRVPGWGWVNNERTPTLAAGEGAPSANRNLSIISPCLSPPFWFDLIWVSMRGHASLKPRWWFILDDGGTDAEACSRRPRRWWRWCCEGSLFWLPRVIKTWRSTPVSSWQPCHDEIGAQLKSGGGRLRAIAARRSRLTGPDGGAAGESLWLSEDRRKYVQLCFQTRRARTVVERVRAS